MCLCSLYIQDPNFDPTGLDIIEEWLEDDPNCPGVKIKVIR
jgi:hypothetical protein